MHEALDPIPSIPQRDVYKPPTRISPAGPSLALRLIWLLHHGTQIHHSFLHSASSLQSDQNLFYLILSRALLEPETLVDRLTGTA